MNVKLFFSFVFFLFFSSAFSQQFQATYGGAVSDDAQQLCLTTDGGYVMAGSTSSFGAGASDVFLFKTNSMGGLLWTKTFGGTNVDQASSLMQTTDGGFIIAGSTNSFGAGNYDFYLIKTDSAGNLQWSKTYGGAMDDKAKNIKQLNDGSFVIVGSSYSFGISDEDVYLVKTNSNGLLIWSFLYSEAGGRYDLGNDIIVTADSGLVITGHTYPLSSGTSAFLFFRLDSSGMVLWNKVYGNPSSSGSGTAAKELNNGDFIVTGTFDNVPYLSLIKTNSSGAVLWSNFYGSPGVALNLECSADNGYLIAGRTQSPPTLPNYAVLLKIDSTGNQQWRRRYDGMGPGYASSILNATDGGYCVSGVSDSNAFFIKTDSMGNSGCLESTITATKYAGPVELVPIPLSTSAVATVENTVSTISGSGGIENILCYTGISNAPAEILPFSIYPNPSEGAFYFANFEKESDIEIYDALGRLIHRSVFNENKKLIDLTGKKSGVCFYRVINSNREVVSGKIILE